MRQDHAVSVYNELLQTNLEFTDLIERLHTFHRVSFGFSRLKFDDYLIIVSDTRRKRNLRIKHDILAISENI